MTKQLIILQISFVWFCKPHFLNERKDKCGGDFHALHALAVRFGQHPCHEITMLGTRLAIISSIILRVSKLRRLHVDRFCVCNTHGRSRVGRVVKPRRKATVEGPLNLKAPPITTSSTPAPRSGVVDVEAHREIAEHKP